MLAGLGWAFSGARFSESIGAHLKGLAKIGKLCYEF
jgi:hypothetical protein